MELTFYRIIKRYSRMLEGITVCLSSHTIPYHIIPIQMKLKAITLRNYASNQSHQFSYMNRIQSECQILINESEFRGGGWCSCWRGVVG